MAEQTKVQVHDAYLVLHRELTSFMLSMARRRQEAYAQKDDKKVVRCFEISYRTNDLLNYLETECTDQSFTK